jgi:uncharacterized protein (TIGR03083 family)
MHSVVEISAIPRISRRSDAREVALAAYHHLFDLLEDLSSAEWTAPTECIGWRVHDMVAHMVGAAHANASIRENLRQQVWGLRHRREYGGNPLDAVNARQIADHGAASPSGLLAALRAKAPAAVEGRIGTPTLMRAVTVPLATSGSTAAGMPRTVNLGHLADVIYTRDVWLHTIDIARAAGRVPDVGASVHRRVVADVVAEWARRHGRPVDVVLTGPAGGHYRNSGSPRSRAAAPALTLEYDAIEFCRVLSGRESGEGLLATRVLF